MANLWTEEKVRLAVGVVEQMTGIRMPMLKAYEGAGLTVDYADDQAVITAESIPALARGCALLAKAMSEGKDALSLHQEKTMGSCGPFIDCSRGAVMNVATCKQYMDYALALGMNLFCLYMEDTYTVPEQPYLGWLRGRYTQEELRELDAYATERGMELLPCIQTLGHMSQFLSWSGVDEQLRDTTSVLMADEEKTYEMLESCIRALRSCVSTKRLHIGMDEAHDVALGAYLMKHGPVDRFALLNRHLGRVVEICKKYDFRPMMWSDMFFRLGSPTGDYYDLDNRVPQYVLDTLPPVDMVYWDYYHKDDTVYEHMLTEHEKMGQVVFAGGNWTWGGFLPFVSMTNETMIPGLAACARHHVDTVIATMWGDDGNEAAQTLAASQLTVFSEACWLGDAATKQASDELAAFMTGLKTECYEAFDLFHDGTRDYDSRHIGKMAIWSDPLLPLLPKDWEKRNYPAQFAKARAILAQQQERLDCRYADALFAAAEGKLQLTAAIRTAYENGSKDQLRTLAERDIPALVETYSLLEKRHRTMWMSTSKRFGWEVIVLRYGGMRARLQETAETLLEYCNGVIDHIDELDADRLDPVRSHHHRNMYTAQYDVSAR